MRVQTIGGRKFAIGLKWVEAASKSYAGEVRQEVGDSAATATVYYVGLQSASAFAVGFSSTGEKLGKQVYSYAATLAAAGSDGVYIADGGDGEWWFVVIHGGMVVPGTDRFDKPDAVRRIATGFANSLNLNYFAGEGISLPTSSKAFGWEDAISGAKPIQMSRLSKGLRLGPLIGIAAVVIVAAGVWMFVIHPKPKQTPEQQREEMRKAYVTAVQQALSSYPVSNDWVDKAYSMAKAFPPVLAGWTLDEVQCKPGSCEATYKVKAAADPRATEPFTERFGKQAVAISQKATSLKVTGRFPAQMFAVTATSINGLPPPPVEITDWTGLLPLHVAFGHIQGSTSIQNLAQSKGGAAVGFSPLVEDQVAVSGTGYLDPSQLQAVMAWGMHGGFRAASMQWHSGFTANGGWRIGLMRIHGG